MDDAKRSVNALCFPPPTSSTGILFFVKQNYPVFHLFSQHVREGLSAAEGWRAAPFRPGQPVRLTRVSKAPARVRDEKQYEPQMQLYCYDNAFMEPF